MSVCICIFKHSIYIHIYLFVRDLCMYVQGSKLLCLCVCMFKHIYAYIYTRVYFCVCVCLCVIYMNKDL